MAGPLWGFAGAMAANALWDAFVSPSIEPAKYRTTRAFWHSDPAMLLSSDQAIWLWKSGVIRASSREQIKDMIMANGYKTDLPAPSLYRMFARGRGLVFDTDHRLEVHYENIRRGAHKPYDFINILNKDFISDDEIYELVNRGMLSEEDAKYILKLKYHGEDALADVKLQLRHIIPPLTDLVHMSVKEAFDPLIVQRFGYHKEFPKTVEPYMKQLGYGGTTGLDIPPGATNNDGTPRAGKATWMDHEWWSHWDAPGRTTGEEMLHRFYRNSRYGPSPEFKDEIEFTSSMLADMYKIHDYPQFWRERMEALSYRPLTRVDARRMFNMDVLDDAGIYHSYRAMGYNDENANRLLQWAKKEKSKAKVAAIYKRTIATAEKLAKLGTITFRQFIDLLQPLEIPDEQIDARWNALLAENQLRQVDSTIKFVRKGYLNGSLDKAQAREMLVNINMLEENIDAYLAIWDMERTLGRKFIQARQAVDMYKMRLQNENQLFRKLVNLGYTEPESSLIIQQANLELTNRAQKELVNVQKERAKAQLAVEKDNLKRAAEQRRAIEKRSSERAKELQKTITKALSAFSEKNIVKWFKAGTMNQGQVVQILRLKGWDDTAVLSFLSVDLGLGASAQLEDKTNETPQSEE